MTAYITSQTKFICKQLQAYVFFFPCIFEYNDFVDRFQSNLQAKWFSLLWFLHYNHIWNTSSRTSEFNYHWVEFSAQFIIWQISFSCMNLTALSLDFNFPKPFQIVFFTIYTNNTYLKLTMNLKKSFKKRKFQRLISREMCLFITTFPWTLYWRASKIDQFGKKFILKIR